MKLQLLRYYREKKLYPFCFSFEKNPCLEATFYIWTTNFDANYENPDEKKPWKYTLTVTENNAISLSCLIKHDLLVSL